MIRKVIIIGSGPAGYTAGIYASRAGLNPLLITGMKIGGQLMDTSDIENFPGYKDGISGPIMMNDLREQAQKFGTEIIYKDVIKVDLSNKPFKVITEDNQELFTESLIISTGAEAKLLGIEAEKKYWGYGVSACATCDGFFFKEKDVVVIGGGDTACEEALYLSNICKTVTMLVRSNEMKASYFMRERIKGKQNISILFETELVDITGDKNVEGIITNNGEIKCSGVFIAIGHSPNNSLFDEWLILDPRGYIVTKNNNTQTSIDGVFACGDVQDSVYRQAITAAGTGCMAALDCERYLNTLNK